MGYTHYWRNPEGFSETQWIAIIADVRKLFAALPDHSDSSGAYHSGDPLAIDDQKGGPPVCGTKQIWFNGGGGHDLNHETFVMVPRPDNFAFCKTARKPYDLVVQAVLLVAKHHKPDLYVSSDGDYDEWEEARKWAQKTLGYDDGFDI